VAHDRCVLTLVIPPVRYTPVVRHRLTDLQAILAILCIVISVH